MSARWVVCRGSSAARGCRRSAEAFASWLGLCPDNRIIGGRILKAGTRKVTNRIADILWMAANALSWANGPMGNYVRRLKGRLGKAEDIVAGAHKLARIIWSPITTGEPCDKKKASSPLPPPPTAASRTSRTKPAPSRSSLTPLHALLFRREHLSMRSHNIGYTLA